MARLQINPDASIVQRNTALWATKVKEQEKILKVFFGQNNWTVRSLDRQNGSHWKVITECQEKKIQINLYVGSIRDESRFDYEYKMQLSDYYPKEDEPGWLTLVLGVYTIDDGTNPREYILAGYRNIKKYNFASNPSLRGTRIEGLRDAKIYGFIETELTYIFRPEFLYYYITILEKQNNDSQYNNEEDESEVKTEQLIYFGAPGTGKSHEIKEKTKGQKVVRTTFHPDSDYSSFVGAYKPTMEEVEAQVVPVVVNSGISLEPKGTYKEKRITYKFVIQAFLKAYLGAWKMYSDNPHSPDPQFLVIEEINRGNCAQIFGDLFQLLDRNEKGFSEYPIEADSDLADAINIAFTNEKSDYKLEKVIDVEGIIKDYISNYGFTLSKDIQEGRVLLLPPNLYIWATMNTSDQSLFPIDSAFKRRWDWQYIKIAEGKQEDSRTPLGWKILVEDKEQDRVRLYDWWRFLQLINIKIFTATQSADKQMGYFFAKATERFSGEKLGIIKDGKFEQGTNEQFNCDFITAETFVNKVLFYLWTDVLKDNEYEDIASLMKDGDKSLSFPDFFGETGKEISPEALRAFLDNVMKKEDVWCDVAEWNLNIQQSDGDSSGNPSPGFKPNSVIFKITENIQDPEKLYKRARSAWRMDEKRAKETKYFYVYSTPVKRIIACYEVTNYTTTESREDGKIRYEFEGTYVEDPMIGQPVEAISHSRGQVVFYPDNWQNKE